MIIDSTRQKINSDVKSVNMMTPRKSTLDFIKQYAAACTRIGTAHNNILIAN